MIRSSNPDLTQCLFENSDDVNPEAFKEYCNNCGLSPYDAYNKFANDIEGVVDELYESACEKFRDDVFRFDRGELRDFEVPTSFVDEAVLISFIRHQVIKRMGYGV